MPLRNLPIRRKVMLLLLAISAVVMVLMCVSFLTYEYITYRQVTERQLATLGRIVAANSTAALAFDNQDDATEVLAALQAERHVVAAALYDENGAVFARYPARAPASAAPAAPGPVGYRFAGSRLTGYEPVLQHERRLGTLYLEFDSGTIMREWVWGTVPIAVGVMAAVLLLAYLLSRVLQKQISRPIAALAETARSISASRDYTLRAEKLGEDEVGRLTESFNDMLARIHELNRDLEQRVADRTGQLESANRELVRSRAQLKSFFESLPGMFLILTPDLGIVTASDAYLKATMTTREGIAGRHLFDVFPDNPDDPNATGASNLRASLERVRLTAETDTMPIQKYDVRGPDGTYQEKYWSPINSPVLGTERQVEFIIHRVEDVTDFMKRKPVAEDDTPLRARMQQMEAEIFQSAQKAQAMNQQLQAANKELEAFSYSVSHDLRAPLRHIDGFAQLLGKHLEKTMDDTARRYLATVTTSAKRLGVLIDELLVFSRMSRTEMRRGDVDARAQIDAVIQEFQTETRDRQIDWKIGDLPHVTGDAVMLRQVWANLIGNALKYSRRRERARIEIRHREDGVDGHVFSIEDNGAGFQMEYAAKLFGVFQRLHTVNEFEGTGIGLANVRRIVERHGGRVWAEGRPDAGATFHFTLPSVVFQPQPATP